MDLNKFHSKHEDTKATFSLSMPKAIFWQATEEPTYHARRKTLSQAFFKSKLPSLIEIIKEVTMRHLRDTDKATEINLPMFTMELQGRIIINIGLGRGLSNIEIPHEDESGEIKNISFILYMQTMLEDATKRELQLLYFLDGHFKWYAMTALDRRIARNNVRARKVLYKIVADRKSGKS